MKKDKQLYLGCIQSKLDGTEHVVNFDDKIQLPDEFILNNVMPPVRNQGTTQTCVCQTLTGVMDFYFNERNNTPGKCNNFSITELYNSRPNKPQEGMSIKDALHYLKHNGLNKEKINSYALVNSGMALKYCLVMFGPCIAGFPVYIENDPYFWREGRGFQGGHCVTITGYNKDGFIIRNSWGYDWGNRGHITISYDEFEKSAFECWTITM